ncbi:hypothetical protein [Ligilactobacillus salitolerans]|uniref:hypothetical protein n=1 Tax=Ligilactobacillus salitolerans TaxID=1808352 RepID=UPI000F60583F|nr:hypothetical protein [Ligilactobacillus salitolerans]
MSKRRIGALLIVLSAFLFFLSTKTVQANTVIEGDVVNDLHASFSMADTSAETVESIKQIAAEDKNVHVTFDNGIIDINEYTEPSADVSLKVNNKSVIVKNGQFKVNHVTANNKTNFVVQDVGTTAENGQSKITSENTLQIVNKIDYGTMINLMDNMNDTSNDSLLRSSGTYPGQKTSGQKVAKGTHVHCNRFNGTKSNHRYYSRLSGQGWVNYYKSDCWYKHKAYKCPFTKADTRCNGLLKKGAHSCSIKGGWPVTCWYRN